MTTAIKIIVFDFDGTLVESNAFKYQAFFDVFPKNERHKEVVRKVLSEYGEESRYLILERILREFGVVPDEIPSRVTTLAEQYNEIVLAGAKTCPECYGAEELLRRLREHVSLYLSSTTPEASLREIVAFRKWTIYFREIFGYPRKKADTLREIMAREHVGPQQALVVGDGESDQTSASDTGCRFFDVNERPLTDLPAYLAA